MIDADGDADAAVARDDLGGLVDGLGAARIVAGRRVLACAAAGAVDGGARLAEHARDAAAGAACGAGNERRPARRAAWRCA